MKSVFIFVISWAQLSLTIPYIAILTNLKNSLKGRSLLLRRTSRIKRSLFSSKPRKLYKSWNLCGRARKQFLLDIYKFDIWCTIIYITIKFGLNIIELWLFSNSLVSPSVPYFCYFNSPTHFSLIKKSPVSMLMCPKKMSSSKVRPFKFVQAPI